MKRTLLEPETLLAHKEFVRAVARRILPDEHLVEDVVQETWLAALRSPPDRDGALRAWLGRVARNLALSATRSRKRRAAREQTAARDERLPSPAEAAAKLEGHRLVVDAVLALHEPLRSTIIYRFYEELPPREIARVQGVPVATVHSRLRRAVARLRKRLDEVHAGDRTAWTLALLPLAGGTIPAAVGGGTTVLELGGAAMKAKLTMSLLAVCILGTAFVVWRAGKSGDGSAARTTDQRRDAPLPGDEAGRDGGATTPRERAARERAAREVYPDRRAGQTGGRPGAEREQDAGKGDTPGAATVRGAPDGTGKASPPPRGFVTGTVRVEGGGPLAGGKVALRWTTRTEDRGLVRHDLDLEPDATGAFRFEGLAPGRYRLEATHPEFAKRSFEFELKEERGAGPFDLRLTGGGAIRVLVRGPTRAPETGRRVRVRRQRDPAVHGGETDADGIVLVKNLPPGRYDIDLPATDAEGRDLPLEGAKRVVTVRPGKTMEVVFDTGCGFSGTVKDAGGRPLVQAYVSLTPAKFGRDGYRRIQARTDERGRFEMRGFAPGEYKLTVQVVGEESWVVSAGLFEFAPGQVRDEAIAISPSYIAGRITRADTGEGLGRFGVSGQGVTVQAYRVKREGGKIVRLEGGRATAFADEKGDYKLVGLEPGLYRLWIFPRDPALTPIQPIVDFSAGGRLDGLDFALQTRALGTLRLKVLEPDGTPATGVDFAQRQGASTTVSLHGQEIGDGVWKFPLEVGERIVVVMRAGFHSQTVNLSVAPGETLDRTVRLEKLAVGKLRLAVLEATGAAATGLEFRLQIGTSGSVPLMGRHLGDGVWEFTLDAGKRVVHLARRGSRLTSVEVSIAEDETVSESVRLGEPDDE